MGIPKPSLGWGAEKGRGNYVLWLLLFALAPSSFQFLVQAGQHPAGMSGAVPTSISQEGGGMIRCYAFSALLREVPKGTPLVYLLKTSPPYLFSQSHRGVWPAIS